MESIVYEEISSLEAMALIDQNDIENLYFVEIYFENQYPYGSNGRTFHFITLGDRKQTEPIKYKSLIPIRTGNIFFPFKEIEAVPGKVIKEAPNRKYKEHRWVVKKQGFKLGPKKPPSMKPSGKNI